ncbi:MAG: hypothetical protein J5I90_10155 [Caldilineales bacterium]|nr:hypothetical protein [Caldilineales bacterium]
MIRIIGADTFVIELCTRMPFRYGIAELTQTPHLFCRVELEVDGRRSAGIAADSLVPKWFTKDPAQRYEDEIAAMLAVIEQAMAFAKQIGAAPDVFDLWLKLYRAQEQWAAATPHPPLLWNFGVSLVERAMIDAYCRATKTTFSAAVRDNHLGVDLGRVHAELAGYSPADLLTPEPSRQIFVRHTVGLSDYLAEADLPENERLCDGLPQTLETSIATYGLQYFKIKVSGDDERDLARLIEIARIIEAATSDFAFTLDGNEQYKTVAAFRDFWNRFSTEPELAEFMRQLLFIEQPFPRTIALSDATRQDLWRWHDRPPMIIDESDAELGSLPRALDCGYAGTSHKNCKGVFKGLANACLLKKRRRDDPGETYLLSGEDLANVGPVALLQDLAVMATLGLSHVERNGHHYFAGLSMFPAAWQTQMQATHPDLYRQTENGWPTLAIKEGRLSLDTVMQSPFGISQQIDLHMAGSGDTAIAKGFVNSQTPPFRDIQTLSPTSLNHISL